MLIKVCLLIVFASVVMSLPTEQPPKKPELSDQKHWEKFKADHKKVYKTPEEEAARFEIFKTNLHTIQEHNKKYDAGEVTYFLGVNDFTDLTHEEFSKTHLMRKLPPPNDDNNLKKPALLGSH